MTLLSGGWRNHFWLWACSTEHPQQGWTPKCGQEVFSPSQSRREPRKEGGCPTGLGQDHPLCRAADSPDPRGSEHPSPSACSSEKGWLVPRPPELGTDVGAGYVGVSMGLRAGLPGQEQPNTATHPAGGDLPHPEASEVVSPSRWLWWTHATSFHINWEQQGKDATQI